jgi:hypothetical protein
MMAKPANYSPRLSLKLRGQLFGVKLQINMPSVFTKLNLKDHKQIVVLGSPESFESELAGLSGVQVIRDLKKAKEVAFSLAFVTTQEQVYALAPAIGKKADGDAIVWFAYPKGSSKKYKSQINRDHGWDVLGREGFEPVRMVAIDEDWSAVRFRRAGFIKNMTRGKEHRLTERAKPQLAQR